MKRPTCETCIYWSSYNDISEGGECRKYVPVMNFQTTGDKLNVASYFRISRRDDWCGEHPDFPSYIVNLRKDQRKK
jgi:hypothetical protein